MDTCYERVSTKMLQCVDVRLCLFIEVAILKKVCVKEEIEFTGIERLWRPCGN